jgi:hypothetical protein
MLFFPRRIQTMNSTYMLMQPETLSRQWMLQNNERKRLIMPQPRSWQPLLLVPAMTPSRSAELTVSVSPHVETKPNLYAVYSIL